MPCYCKENHFYGIQLDFEMIHVSERDLLTAFYQNVAKAMHANGLIVSFAVAPVVTNDLHTSPFLKRAYENWEGVYDLKKLGEAADFISIMTYNQHVHGTTPGSTANWSWMNAVLNYTLQYVPPEKISLGIPSYSTYWFMYYNEHAHTINVHTGGFSYETIQKLARRFDADFQWDKNAKVHYAIVNHNWLNEYLFAEDKDSFTAKYDLVKQHHLRGISVFDLGTEDPGIWKKLAS